MENSWMETISPEMRDAQFKEYEKERDSIERHRVEAQQLVSDRLRGQAQILILDLSQGGLNPSLVNPDLMDRLRLDQFGGGRITHGEIFRHLLGFEPNDPSVCIWDVPTEDQKYIPYPDAWIATGGPAMPSELDPGNETANTAWLRRAVDAIKALSQAKVPGVAVCLGHQLFEYSKGAKVGKRHAQREIGTQKLYATEIGKQLQLLQGFWDDQGEVEIASSHSEGVKVPPLSSKSLEVVAFNDYSDYQAAAHALEKGQTVEEADAQDSLVLSIQNHPELLAIFLEVLRTLRGEAIEKEGIDPKKMFFKNTPAARQIWKNFIELAARRLEKRK